MQKPKTIEERLALYPHLRERIEAILKITEGATEGPDTADAVEEKVIQEMRKLGQEVLEGWAEQKVSRETSVYKMEHRGAHSHKKKGPGGIPPMEKSK